MFAHDNVAPAYLFHPWATVLRDEKGIAVADAGRRADLNDWLAHKVRPMFEERVLPVSEDVMFKRRLLVEEGRKAGHTFSQPTTGRHAIWHDFSRWLVS